MTWIALLATIMVAFLCAWVFARAVRHTTSDAEFVTVALGCTVLFLFIGGAIWL